MEAVFNCWKLADGCDNAEQSSLHIGEATYALRPVTDEEIEKGNRCLEKWYVERKYKVQVAGLGSIHYEMRSEIQKLSFEELIFHGAACIGAYHDGLVFLFDNEKTHYREKYLGEMKISYDQGIAFYDYYYLHSR